MCVPWFSQNIFLTLLQVKWRVRSCPHIKTIRSERHPFSTTYPLLHLLIIPFRWSKYPESSGITLDILLPYFTGLFPPGSKICSTENCVENVTNIIGCIRLWRVKRIVCCCYTYIVVHIAMFHKLSYNNKSKKNAYQVVRSYCRW